MSQATWRHIQRLGLPKVYKDNEQIAKECKTSLAFFPIEKILNKIFNMFSTFFQELFSSIFYCGSKYISAKNA